MLASFGHQETTLPLGERNFPGQHPLALDVSQHSGQLQRCDLDPHLVFGGDLWHNAGLFTGDAHGTWRSHTGIAIEHSHL